MKKLLSFDKALQGSLILFGLLNLFHLAIIIGIVFFNYAPVDYLWGGRMETKEQLLSYEIISLVVAFVCLLIVLIKSGRIHLPKLSGVVRIALWVLFVLFALNTVGNLLARTTFEKLFAIVTFLLALFCLRLALEKR